MQLPNGMSRGAAVAHLLAAQKALSANPSQALQHLARSYGVDIRTLIPDDGTHGRLDHVTGQHRQAESALRHALSEVDRLKSELAQRDDAGGSRKADAERAVFEAKRQAAVNQRSDSRGCSMRACFPR